MPTCALTAEAQKPISLKQRGLQRHPRPGAERLWDSGIHSPLWDGKLPVLQFFHVFHFKGMSGPCDPSRQFAQPKPKARCKLKIRRDLESPTSDGLVDQ